MTASELKESIKNVMLRALKEHKKLILELVRSIIRYLLKYLLLLNIHETYTLSNSNNMQVKTQTKQIPLSMRQLDNSKVNYKPLIPKIITHLLISKKNIQLNVNPKNLILKIMRNTSVDPLKLAEMASPDPSM